MSAEPRPAADQDGSGLRFRRVLCGIDGSDQALIAARQARDLAAEGAELWGVAAWDPGVAMHAGIHAAEVAKDLRNEASVALQRARDVVPELQPVRVRGRDVPALLELIGELRAELVAVGSHGRSRVAGIVFGSVASAMAHYAPCSVLIARSGPAAGFPGTILHANDGSAESLDAARVAGRLAAAHGSTVITMHVRENGDGIAQDAVAILEESGREPILKVEEGSPGRALCEAAEASGAGLVVMGSRGKTGLRALGSVSEHVAHHAPCSVLIVRRAAHPARDDSG